MKSESNQSQRLSRRAERKTAAEAAQRRRLLSMFGGALVVALSIVASLILVNQPAKELPAIEAGAPVDPNVPTDGRTLGSADAPVKVVEWGDYQ